MAVFDDEVVDPRLCVWPRAGGLSRADRMAKAVGIFLNVVSECQIWLDRLNMRR